MKQKWIAASLCVVLLTGTAAASWPSWAESAHVWAQEKGMSAELLEEPLAAVTRGQVARMLYEAAGSPTVSGDVPFTDLSSDETAAVTWAYDQGYVEGVGGGRYAPQRPVTRQEFAAMLHRGADEPAWPEDCLASFADGDDVAEWADEAMNWCIGTGRMQGKTAGRLAPQDTIRTAEAVLMLERAEGDAENETVVTVNSWDDMMAKIQQAIIAAEQPPAMRLNWDVDTATLEMDVLNGYYALLSARPELKYAYDLRAAYGGDGVLRCAVSYMPYRTGEYPEDYSGESVDSLTDLIALAEAHLDTASTPIRITNRDLTVDDMNRALQQVGGGYLLCQLNRDGTAITVTATTMTHDAGLERLDQIQKLADAVVEKTVKPGMTDLERAKALYTYLTDTVSYDFRYYSDRPNMPFDSQTAYGALHDHLAICGGYAQALQVLFQSSGIPCYTVSGKLGSEYHMWNVAYVDGAWRYYDATTDRGMSQFGFRCFGMTAEELTGHTWDLDFVERLTGSAAVDK